MGQDGLASARFLYDIQNNAKASINIHSLHSLRPMLPSLLDYYTGELSKTNGAEFRFLSELQKQKLKSRLIYTYYLLYAKHQLDTAESRGHSLSSLVDNMQTCSRLIDRLTLEPGQDISPVSDLNLENLESDKPLIMYALRYMAAQFVDCVMFILDGVKNFGDKMTGYSTGALRETIAIINERRLYWVWGGSAVSAAFDFLPNSFLHTQQAHKTLGNISTVTGYLSFILYYLRLGTELMLLFKHTLNGPWMSEKESQIPWTERFITQWEQRKFSILNDVFWATANLACFFWLVGTGTLGYLGGGLTIALLLMDVCLTLWRYWEESTAYNKKMRDIALAYENVKAEMARLDRMDPRDADKLAALEQQKEDLRKLQASTAHNWKYQKMQLDYDVCYGIALMFAFSMLVSFMFPPSLIPKTTGLILGLIGATLCFLFTLAYSVLSSQLEKTKTLESQQKIHEEGQELLEKFKQETNEDAKRLLYLQILGLKAQSEHHERMLRFQTINLIRSIIVDSLIPAFVFSSLLLLPFDASAGVLGAAVLLMLLSKLFVKQLEPTMGEPPEFDEAGYLDFCDHTPKTFQTKKSNSNGFFNHKVDEERIPLLGENHLDEYEATQNPANPGDNPYQICL
jgi:hypothetical protein